MPTHDDFFRTFLGHIGVKPRTAALRALACVSIYESSLGDLAWNNPLAVATPIAGSKPLYPGYKGACAQIYPTVAAGMAATVDLFEGSHWADVRAHLKSSLTRGPMLDAFTRAYTWADVDFRTLNQTTKTLDARRAHPLRGPS